MHIRGSDPHAPSSLQVDLGSQHLSFHAEGFSDGITAACFSPPPHLWLWVAAGLLQCSAASLHFSLVCQIRKEKVQCKIPTTLLLLFNHIFLFEFIWLHWLCLALLYHSTSMCLESSSTENKVQESNRVEIRSSLSPSFLNEIVFFLEIFCLLTALHNYDISFPFNMKLCGSCIVHVPEFPES